MWRQFGVVLLGEWLVITPLLWDQGPAAKIVEVIGGGLAVCLGLVIPFYARALNWAALVGFMLILSALAVHGGGPLTYGNLGTAGALILLCAVAPRVHLLQPGEKVH